MQKVSYACKIYLIPYTVNSDNEENRFVHISSKTYKIFIHWKMLYRAFCQKELIYQEPKNMVFTVIY